MVNHSTLNLSVEHWMNPHFRTLTKECTIQEALMLLIEAECSMLPVVDDDRFIGVIKLKECLQSLDRDANWQTPLASMIDTFSYTMTAGERMDCLLECPTYIVNAVNGRLEGVIDKQELLAYSEHLFKRFIEAEKSAEWFKLCLDTAYEGVTIVDEHGIVRLLNETYSRFVKVEREEAIGLPVEKVIENTRLPVVLKTGVPERNQAHRLQGQRLVVHRIPIWKDERVVGAIGMLVYEGVSQIYDALKQLEQLEANHSLYAPPFGRLPTSHRKMRFEDIIGESLPISKAKKIARKAADSRATVVITGESGVGKEQFARAIHDMGVTSSGPFVAVNCAAIPDNLIESELFGYADGAFTGAKKGGKPGKFELAHNGTLFLDEIGDMPLSVQVKILRALQEKEVERVGGTDTIPIDFRLIVATNKDLKELVRQGEFREDLYYRLFVIPLHIPPLRERKPDIPLIIADRLPELCALYGVGEKTLDREVLRLMFRYNWPGNVRELMNVLERLVALSDSLHIRMSDIPEELYHELKRQHAPQMLRMLTSRNQDIRSEEVEEEKQMIEIALREVNGNKAEAARRLGISRATLYNKLTRFNM